MYHVRENRMILPMHLPPLIEKIVHNEWPQSSFLQYNPLSRFIFHLLANQLCTVGVFGKQSCVKLLVAHSTIVH